MFNKLINGQTPREAKEAQRLYEEKFLQSYEPYRLPNFGNGTTPLPPHVVDLMLGLDFCNSRCIDCEGIKDPQKHKNNLTLSGMLRLLTNILSFVVGDNYVREIHLSHNWSDPLLSPFFEKVISFIREDPLRRTIMTITNGILIKQKATALAQCDYVTVSINGTSPSSYQDYHRKDDYTRVLQGAATLRNLAEVINPQLSMYSSLILQPGVFGSLKQHLHALKDAGFNALCVRQNFNEHDPQTREYYARKINDYAKDNPPIPIILKDFAENQRICSRLCAAMRYWASIDTEGNLIHCIHNTKDDYGVGNLLTDPLQTIWERMYGSGVVNNGTFICSEKHCPSTLASANSIDTRDLHAYYPGVTLTDIKVLQHFPQVRLINSGWNPQVDIGFSDTVKDYHLNDFWCGKNLINKHGEDIGFIARKTKYLGRPTGDTRILEHIFNNKGEIIASAIVTAGDDTELKFFKPKDVRCSMDHVEAFLSEELVCRKLVSRSSPETYTLVDPQGNVFADLAGDTLIEWGNHTGTILGNMLTKRDLSIPSEEQRIHWIETVRNNALPEKTKEKINELTRIVSTMQNKYPQSFICDPFPFFVTTDFPLDMEKWKVYDYEEIEMTTLDGQPSTRRENDMFKTPVNTATAWEHSIKNIYLQLNVLHRLGFLKESINYDEILTWFIDSLKSLENHFKDNPWAYTYLTESLKEPFFLVTALKLYLQRNISFLEQIQKHLDFYRVQDYERQMKGLEAWELANTLVQFLNDNQASPVERKKKKDLLFRLMDHTETEEDILQAKKIISVGNSRPIF
jgi:sulfatase maturation enzyme AslB (radical SAM superfamily)